MKRRAIGALLATLAVASFSATAAPSITSLKRAYSASVAMEEGEPLSEQQTYRAGHFDGVLAAVAALAEARGGVCLPGCSCELREAVGAWLESADAEADALPAMTDFIAKNFACPQ